MKPRKTATGQFSMFGTPSNQVVAIDIDDRHWPDRCAEWYLGEAYGPVPKSARVPLSEEAAHHRLIYMLPRVLSSHVSLIISKTIVIWTATSHLPDDLRADAIEAPDWLVELVEDASRGVYPDDVRPGKPVNLLRSIADAASLVDGGAVGVDGGAVGVDGAPDSVAKTVDGGRDPSVDGVSVAISAGVDGGMPAVVDGGAHSHSKGVDGGLDNVDGVAAALRTYLSSAADYDLDALPPFRRDGYCWFYAEAFARSMGADTGPQQQAVYAAMNTITAIESRRPIRVKRHSATTVARMHRVPDEWLAG